MQAGNKRSYNMKRNGIRSLILAIGISAGLVATTATGGILPITLQDGNTTVTIDPNNPADGVNSWTVNGVNQLLQQWFWYRIGNTGPAYSIDTLGALVTAQSGAAFATVSYSNSTSGLSVEVDYTLIGSPTGNGQSDLDEGIKLVNSTSSAMNLQFFQYSNFQLNGSPSGGTLSFPDAHTVDESNSIFTLAETVASPAASHHEGAPNLLGTLTSPTLTTLSDLPAVGAPGTGTGDMNWAYEWDLPLPAGGAQLISDDNRLNVFQSAVPEPSTLALLSSAVLGLIGCAWRRAVRRGTLPVK
jgi:hypothetical protein